MLYPILYIIMHSQQRNTLCYIAAICSAICTMLHYALHYQPKKDIMPLVTVTMQKASAEISICVKMQLKINICKLIC